MSPYPTLILLVASVASAAEDVSVQAVRRGAAVEISARATVEVSHDVLWNTLTDYDRLADFIPGMRVSRVVEWRGNEAIVEQMGEARFLFFRIPIEVTVGSASHPPNAIDVRLLKGNLRRLDGGYRIEAIGDGRIVLRWNGVIEPETLLPPIIGAAVLRTTVEDQFIGMVREVERRAALSRAREHKGKS